jgi:putative flippase GtrA
LAFLAERRAWPVGWALAVAILLALVNNFFWNWLFTFRISQVPSAGPRAGILSRLVHYGEVCTTGVALNASLTLLLNWRGVLLPLASAAGVALGGAWNLFFNVPAIWRSWDSPAPRRHGPVWDDSGNRRLAPSGHTSSSRQKGVLGGIP